MTLCGQFSYFCGGNLRICWWTPEVKNIFKLKKESCQAFLICGTLEAAYAYRLAK